ncbi:MAG: acetyl-CoA C-acetyltransferase [Anaerolineae bacterium]|nr:acetyl-CoA C-acetyltransferase [Anaerolineae bacterium]
MNDVVILSAVRTPIGAFGGALAEVSAVQLGVTAARAALGRAGVAPDAVDEAIFGCARQAGNGPNPARQIAWHTGLPVDRPAYTVNKACASGLKAVTLGVQSISTGENEVVLAGGVEQMSQIPYLLMRGRWGYRLGDDTLVDAMYRDGYLCPMAEMAMGETAELLVERYGISREAQDAFAMESQRKAVAAWESGAFDDEVVPVEVPGRKGEVTVVARDERPRPDASLEKLARLQPVFREGGTVTPGNASGIADGGAALVLTTAGRARGLGARPLARVVGFASGAVHPRDMGLGPVPAVHRLLERSGMALSDFDLIELNEAFAVQVLAVERELAWDVARRNVHGGAVALGHPTGCSGARILVTLLHALRTHDKTVGLATLCVSGGLGMAVAVERL